MTKAADSKSILVVDDDPSFVGFVCVALERLGVPSEVALTGTAAIQRLVNHGSSGVLLDLGLPDMDGLDVLREIRHRGDSVPVAVLTGAGSVPAVVEAMKLGVVDFVEKPVRLPRLTQAVLSLHSPPPTHPPAQPADQLVSLMTAVVDSAGDVPSVQAWCLLVGKSRSSLYALCEMVGVSAKAALDLARLLRAARHSEGTDLREAFLVADPRTVDRLLSRAGQLRAVDSADFRKDLLMHQRLITDQRVLDRLVHHLRTTRSSD